MESHINITKFESSNNIYKIYETSTDFIETKYLKIKINNYDFNIIVHQNISYPYKLIEKYNFNYIYDNDNGNIIEIKKENINFGENSIGFKRYVGNMMSWNIHNKIDNDNNEDKLYGKIITCMFQIDFGTRIGLPICLHSDVTNIEYGGIYYNTNDTENNPLLSKSKYFYESKQFLNKNSDIMNHYKINYNTNNNLEYVFSDYDFYFFITPHINNLINNYDIVHYTALCLTDKVYHFKYNDKKIKFIGLPSKPLNNEKYCNIMKEHYDKIYITNISLTNLIVNNVSRHVTYNKNYTSFAEDLLYSKLLFDTKKIIIPHPFLAISKCIQNTDKDININSDKKYEAEAIYILLPNDDIGNSKIFEINNYINKEKHKVKMIIQNDEIKKLSLQKINKYKNLAGGFNDENIKCSISYKNKTKEYIDKYKNTTLILNQNIDNLENKLFLYSNLLIFMDESTNIETYKKIVNEYKNYNEKYNFTNKTNLICVNTINNKNQYIDFGMIIMNFMIDYLINNFNYTEVENAYVINNIDNKAYYIKYIKYKQKYINLKNNILNQNTF